MNGGHDYRDWIIAVLFVLLLGAWYGRHFVLVAVGPLALIVLVAWLWERTTERRRRTRE